MAEHSEAAEATRADKASALAELEAGERARVGPADGAGAGAGPEAEAGAALDDARADVKAEDAGQEAPARRGAAVRAALRRLRPRSRVAKVCVGTWLVVLVWISSIFIRLRFAASGSECPALGAPSPSEWDATGLAAYNFSECAPSPSAEELPMAMLVFKGEHNSYHKRVQPDAQLLGLNALIADLQYDKLGDALTAQLDAGHRHFELDVHFGLDKSRVMIFHLPVVDWHTVCYCLATCLGQLRAWQDANPGHLPVTVEYEIKSGNPFEAWREYYEQPAQATMLHIDETIRTVWKDRRAAVFTPDDLLRGSGKVSLAEAVEVRGFPTVGSMRGKVLFTMYEGAWSTSEYTRDAPALQGRTSFIMASAQPTGKTAEAHVAMQKIDGASENLAKVESAVRRGYLVRSRANSVGDVEDEYRSRAAATAQSGAQLVSFDVDTEMVWAKYFNASGANAVCAPQNSPTRCGTVQVACPPGMIVG